MTFREVKRQRTISSTFKSVEAQTDEESGPGNPKVFDIWTGPDVEDWKRSELNAAERNPSKSTSEGSNEIPLADVV